MHFELMWVYFSVTVTQFIYLYSYSNQIENYADK